MRPSCSVGCGMMVLSPRVRSPGALNAVSATATSRYTLSVMVRSTSGEEPEEEPPSAPSAPPAARAGAAPAACHASAAAPVRAARDCRRLWGGAAAPPPASRLVEVAAAVEDAWARAVQQGLRGGRPALCVRLG
jgi:hypothetical protein